MSLTLYKLVYAKRYVNVVDLGRVEFYKTSITLASHKEVDYFLWHLFFLLNFS